MTDERINIELSNAQALVLFDWISRDGLTEGLSYEDPAEELSFGHNFWGSTSSLNRCNYG